MFDMEELWSHLRTWGKGQGLSILILIVEDGSEANMMLDKQVLHNYEYCAILTLSQIFYLIPCSFYG